MFLSARAGTTMAAIRTKFEAALERSRFPESDWTVAGITAYLLTAPSQQLAPNEAVKSWKELPETSGTLRTRTTAASCGASSPTASRSKAHLAGAEEDRELLGLLLLPRAGWPPRTAPPGLAARSGRRGGGLLRLADGPRRELRRH